MAHEPLGFLLLRATGVDTIDAFVHNHEVERVARPTAADLLTSACAAAAGMTMTLAYRRSVIAGPLIALVLVPVAAMADAALVSGQWQLLVDAAQRIGLDVLSVLALGVLLVLFKQATVHRRAPLV